MTQHERIYELVKNGDWVCQARFWDISKSPHKRRGEMSKNHKDFIQKHDRFHIDSFEERKCDHGIDGAKDYKIKKVEKVPYGTVDVAGERITLYK